MTANHAHTPTIDHIREQFIEAWAGDFVFGKVDAAKYFDRALDAHNARIEAAAEQRGERRAAKNLRPFVSRVAEHRALIGTETAREAKLLAYELNRLEGDDETH